MEPTLIPNPDAELAAQARQLCLSTAASVMPFLSSTLKPDGFLKSLQSDIFDINVLDLVLQYLFHPKICVRSSFPLPRVKPGSMCIVDEPQCIIFAAANGGDLCSFSFTGKLLRSYRGEFSDRTRSMFTHIAVCDDLIFVMDIMAQYDDPMIRVFHLEGPLLYQWKIPDSQDFALDRETKSIYLLTNSWKTPVQIMNFQGDVIGTWDWREYPISFDYYTDPFNNDGKRWPRFLSAAITIHPAAKLALIDRQEFSQVCFFTLEGTFVRAFSYHENAHVFSTLPLNFHRNLLFMADRESHVIVYSLTGNWVTEFSVPSGESALSVATQHDHIIISTQKNVYVCTWGSKSFKRITSNKIK